MRIFTLVSLITFLNGFAANANVLVDAPAGARTAEGNSSLSPLHTGDLQARFQQVYSASLFSNLPPGGGWIQEVIFRTDRGGNEFLTTLSNVEVSLSTTQLLPDSLSAIFSANVGLGAQTVLGPGPLTLRGSWGPQPPGDPEPDSILFNLHGNPYLYNPQAGNLLLDIQNFEGGFTSPFDAIDATGDAVSSVFAEGSTMPVAGSVRTVGLYTVFSISPVPEPTPTLLLLAASVAVVVRKLTRFHGRGRMRRSEAEESSPCQAKSANNPSGGASRC